MKRLMYVRINGYDMLVSYDKEDKTVRYTEQMDVEPLLHHLDDVEDDTSWVLVEDINDVEDWLGIDYNNPESPRIIEEIEKDL